MDIFKEKTGDLIKILSKAVSEGIIIINEKQLLVTVNNSINKTFGYEKAEILRPVLTILLPLEFSANKEYNLIPYLNIKEHHPLGCI